MSRTKKPMNLESEDNSMSEEYGAVKQMLRRISKGGTTNLAMGLDSIADVDVELDGWYQKGYVLKQTIHMGDEPESYNMFYILAKA